MKRAKLILAAVAVFAVVGGVYASKAHRNQSLFCTAIAGQPGALVNNVTTTVLSAGYYATCTLAPDEAAIRTKITVAP